MNPAVPNRGMGPPWGAFCQITLTSCFITDARSQWKDEKTIKWYWSVCVKWHLVNECCVHETPLDRGETDNTCNVVVYKTRQTAHRERQWIRKQSAQWVIMWLECTKCTDGHDFVQQWNELETQEQEWSQKCHSLYSYINIHNTRNRADVQYNNRTYEPESWSETSLKSLSSELLPMSAKSNCRRCGSTGFTRLLLGSLSTTTAHNLSLCNRMLTCNSNLSHSYYCITHCKRTNNETKEAS